MQGKNFVFLKGVVIQFISKRLCVRPFKVCRFIDFYKREKNHSRSSLSAALSDSDISY